MAAAYKKAGRTKTEQRWVHGNVWWWVLLNSTGWWIYKKVLPMNKLTCSQYSARAFKSLNLQMTNSWMDFNWWHNLWMSPTSSLVSHIEWCPQCFRISKLSVTTITSRATCNMKRLSVKEVNNDVARCVSWDATGKIAFDGANEKHTNVGKRREATKGIWKSPCNACKLFARGVEWIGGNCWINLIINWNFRR